MQVSSVDDGVIEAQLLAKQEAIWLNYKKKKGYAGEGTLDADGHKLIHTFLTGPCPRYLSC